MINMYSIKQKVLKTSMGRLCLFCSEFDYDFTSIQNKHLVS